jgi:O-methyltransferase domain/Dimerisation domain
MSNTLDWPDGPAAHDAPSPDAIMRLGSGYWSSKTLLSAVELGLFTELAAAGELDAEALRGRLGLHRRGARDFFDALVALGMLERHDGRYRNTPATELFLDRARPTYVGGLLEMSSERSYSVWGSLTEGLRSGRPQNEVKGGADAFAAIYADPRRLRGFVRAMTGVSAGAAQALVSAFPWEGRRTVVDVGCAEGCVPVRLALAHPHLRGGGFDLPAVGPFFDDYVAAAGLGDRLCFHPGDFLTDGLPSAEVLIMGHILQDWSLAEKRLLLRRAHAALPEGGALIVYEPMIDDDRRENAFGLLMSLNMLIETPGGFNGTPADCRRWMSEAGFTEVSVRHLVGPISMATAIK